MTTMASHVTSLTVVYSTVYPLADQRKHQSSASLAFVWGIRRGPVNSPHKWPVTRKMFPFDDVIMWPCAHWTRETVIMPTLSALTTTSYGDDKLGIMTTKAGLEIIMTPVATKLSCWQLVHNQRCRGIPTSGEASDENFVIMTTFPFRSGDLLACALNVMLMAVSTRRCG